ncbi:hypothetical protein RclHR1_01150016 [Rhizophagus clarus]|uniref:Uncharacterized protein n=1 Tax=Rhizophagus clarus TaxID=94130 RepID=A0A2Z6Q8U3_9GLOM|nr:hypothetical protein RclHR1_01150016 [Rhizophagus clarus]
MYKCANIFGKRFYDSLGTAIWQGIVLKKIIVKLWWSRVEYKQTVFSSPSGMQIMFYRIYILNKIKKTFKGGW